jgi:hypothetical protein
VEVPTAGDPAEASAAVFEARAFLREQGGASMKEIVANVMPDHPLGYDVPELESGDRYRGAWWRRVVKPGLEAVDDVEKPTGGRSEWRYTGESDA